MFRGGRGGYFSAHYCLEGETLLMKLVQRMPRARDVLAGTRAFARDERGLVTVEWVSLAGAVVIGGITVAWLVLNTLITPANNVASNVQQCETSAAQHTGSTRNCQ